MLRLKFAARSDVGMIRSGNEDSYDADYNANRGVFVVADGMGGHAAGEVASLMAVEAVMKELSDLKEIDERIERITVARCLRIRDQAGVHLRRLPQVLGDGEEHLT